MGDWYLVGYCQRRREVLLFRTDRIKEVKETGAGFERPADFDINKYSASSFRVFRGAGPPQQVRLRFSPEAARFVKERQWHPSQEIKEQTDGGIEMTLKVSHLFEVKRWVLSYGVECEVLEPEELRREVGLEVGRMMGGA